MPAHRLAQLPAALPRWERSATEGWRLCGTRPVGKCSILYVASRLRRAEVALAMICTLKVERGLMRFDVHHAE